MVAGGPLFVFAAIGDAHISLGGGPGNQYLKANAQASDLLRAYVHDINAHVPPVGFTVLLGDVTDKGRAAEFDIARGIVDTLASTWYAVVGNHDNFLSDDKRAWKDFSGCESTSYAFDRDGFHFVVIDCTRNPYGADGVDCDPALREWVARDLALHRDQHVILFSHYNMWERRWSPEFDTTGRYVEHTGIEALRSVIEQAGNVVAVVNGHVHANRVEVHSGIYYVDVGATLVGRPSVRYFSVFPDRIEVTYAYVSDRALLDQVAAVGKQCSACFSREKVVDFVDGQVSDKQFTIRLK